MKIFTAEQMRGFDRAATQEYSVPSIVLMENAALRVVEFLNLKCAPLRDKRVVIFCGKGNNGGDGFAIARHLHNAGCRVQVLLAAAPTDYKGDAQVNYEILTHTLDEANIVQLTGKKSSLSPAQREALQHTDIVLDAILGTGFQGAVRGDATIQAFKLLGQTPGQRIAIDVVSATNSDTGEASELAVKADYTVTFAAPKRGQFLRQGLELSGEIWVGGIGTPAAQMAATPTGCRCLTAESARAVLPSRPIDSHKGDAGRVVLIGGSYGMSGAPALAARAVMRSGAGLCIATLPDKILPIFAASFSEATSRPLPCDDDGQLLERAADELAGIWENAHAVALGPGLSRSTGALDFAHRVVRECPQPLIIDADALYALRKISEDVQQRRAPTILTPHPGEMGELMEMKTGDVQNDRIAVARACAEKYNAIVVLKGSRSIIALPAPITEDDQVYFNLTGNSGMASGGSGDVLTGTIAGLLAQLKDATVATVLGVYLHGLAGDIAYGEHGVGLIATDIAEALPEAELQLRRDDMEIKASLQRLQ